MCIGVLFLTAQRILPENDFLHPGKLSVLSSTLADGILMAFLLTQSTVHVFTCTQHFLVIPKAILQKDQRYLRPNLLQAEVVSEKVVLYFPLSEEAAWMERTLV